MRNVKRKIFRILVILLIMTSVIFSLSKLNSKVEASDITYTVTFNVTYKQTQARSMLEDINEFRTGDDAWYWDENDENKIVCENLSELTYDYGLEEVAMQRAAEIAMYCDHTRPDGTSCYTAYPSFNGEYTRGENIAAGYTSASSAFTGWKEEDDGYSGQGHRRNMLESNFKYIGIACVYVNGTYYWVQEFSSVAIELEETEANDSKADVNIDITSANISSITNTLSSSSYTLEYGDSIDLATVTTKIVTPELWPSGKTCTVTVDYNWSIDDETVIKIEDDKIVSTGVGVANLTTTILGEDIIIPITVTEKSISNATITLSQDTFTYDRTEKTPTVTVSLDGAVLDSNYYDISYADNTNIGTATVTITGKGIYKDSCEKNFTIYCEHDYEKTVVEATCTEDGCVTYTCSICGDTYEEDGDRATGHTYTSVITKEATCEEDGVKTYTCSDCGDEYTELVSATGHTSGSTVIENEIQATCSEDGSYDEVIYCTKCSKEISRNKVTISATGHTYTSVITKEATCEENGVKTYTCSDCGDEYTELVSATGHTYVEEITKATTSKDGSIVKTCTDCGVSETETIYYPKTITLSTTTYTYNGSVKKPSVTVKDSNGTQISSSNYTVTYASGRKNVGSYKVTIKFKGNYSGTVTKTFKIIPKGTSISSLKASSKAFTVKLKKQTTQTTGYQIQYSTSSKFTSSTTKTVTISSNKTVSKKISKLKSKKKYYVRVRTYKTVSGTKYYSAWSSAKSIKTK